jgi:hypothetical protein
MAILSILVFATFPASVLARTIKIIDPPYLAVCNGSADTTSAIQGAINDARSGDYIQLPSGTCKVSHTLSLTGKVGIVVRYNRMLWIG